MRRPAIAGARSGAKHAVQLLGMCKWTRTVHWVFRLPEREEFHPCSLTSRDPAVARESTERELQQLWGVHRPANQLGVSVLPFRHFDAGHEAAATDAGATQGSCRASAGRSDATPENPPSQSGNVSPI